MNSRKGINAMKKLAVLILVLILAFAAMGAMADTCTHEETYTVTMQWLSTQYTPVDDVNHKAEYIYEYEERCSNCGETLRTYQAADEEGSYTSSHSYDESGYCSTCDHHCAHGITETKFSFDDNCDIQTSYIEIQGDNIHHTRQTTGPCTVSVVCSGCGKTLSSEYVASATETTEENHTYDDNGACTTCGHQNTCEHAGKYVDCWISDENPGYEEIEGDNEYHYQTGKGSTHTYCPDCELWFNDYTESDNVKKKESHVYYNYEISQYQDTCVHCEHKCTHVWEDGRCRICNMSCAHESYDNGVCTVCGHVCEHTWYDEEGHQSDTCRDCGLKCAHDWDNGNCRICNMSCAHEGLDEQPVTTETVADYMYNDGLTHNIVNKTYNYRQCPICGYKQIDYNTVIYSDPTGTEAHTYDESGYCSVCHDYCRHEHMIAGTEKTETEGPKMVRINGNQHAEATVKVTYQTCQDCNARVRMSEEIADITEGTEANHSFDEYGYCNICQSDCNHEYENGYCKYCSKACDHSFNSDTGVCGNCGYQCQHEYASKTFAKEYFWVNMDQHEVRSIPTLHCPTCGYSGVVTEEISKSIEDHSGSGVCDICGLSLTENIEWTYDDMWSALVFSGQGPIQDYASGDETPWANYRDTAKFIFLQKDITGIGAYAFAGFTNPDLRVEFLENSKPTIDATAFDGTTAVCRYYSDNASWTGDGLTWIHMPLFDTAYFNNPPTLCFRDHWFIYDQNNQNKEVNITTAQALEYTFSGHK